MEYYSSTHPDFCEIKEQKQGNWTLKWFEPEYENRCVNDPKEMARKKESNKKRSLVYKDTGKPVPICKKY